MNGALVIPKLMCIKFYRAEVERTAAKPAKNARARLKINKKKPRRLDDAGAFPIRV